MDIGPLIQSLVEISQVFSGLLYSDWHNKAKDMRFSEIIEAKLS
jgi:hypothetical protein